MFKNTTKVTVKMFRSLPKVDWGSKLGLDKNSQVQRVWQIVLPVRENCKLMPRYLKRLSGGGIIV